jgi:CxxC-x17-CxxC domain-containing protein
MSLKNDRFKFKSIPKTTFRIVCSECGTQSEVTIEPLEGEPIFCRDCFDKRARTEWHTIENIHLLFS